MKIELLTPKTEKELEQTAKDAAQYWRKYGWRKYGAGETEPLWQVILKACRLSYILGETDCDYRNGRALDTLSSKLPEPTSEQSLCKHEKWSALEHPPRHCIECGLLMWDAGD